MKQRLSVKGIIQDLREQVKDCDARAGGFLTLPNDARSLLDAAMLVTLRNQLRWIADKYERGELVAKPTGGTDGTE